MRSILAACLASFLRSSFSVSRLSEASNSRMKNMRAARLLYHTGLTRMFRVASCSDQTPSRLAERTRKQ